MPDQLALGRDAYARQDWAEARTQLLAADRAAALAPNDLELLAISCFLVGQDLECDDFTQRAHAGYLAAGDRDGAVRAGRSLAMRLFNSGEYARAGGWLARCRRILEEGGADSVEFGYLLIPQALQSIIAGEPEQAFASFQEAGLFATRFGDSDLLAMSRMGQGRTLIGLGEIARGVALLDELMVSVTSGELSPLLTGLIYCATIEACEEIFDLRRAHEWTGALDRWCETQPGLVAYRGSCVIFRAHLMQLHGDWAEAMVEVERAREWMLRPSIQPGAGDAFYELAELHRLRGDFASAEAAFREVTQFGRSAQPGLALMRLVQGQVIPAAAAVRRELDEARERHVRCRLLPAFVEISIAADDLDAAQSAVDELAQLARDLAVPYPNALASHARGALQLARGEHRAALESLRGAAGLWREVQAPYEGARTGVLIGLACRLLGDTESATLELDAARKVFDRLGADPDTRHVDELLHPDAAAPAGGLSERELQVLRLIASGKSNRAIAGELFISEKTVARHVSNIFDKLGVSSRPGATAWAYQRNLI